LHRVFRVFVVTRDVHGEAEDFSLVTIYKLFKSRGIARFRGRNEQMLVFADYIGRKPMWIRRAQGRRFRKECE
jgi:hypothetical protein